VETTPLLGRVTLRLGRVTRIDGRVIPLACSATMLDGSL